MERWRGLGGGGGIFRLKPQMKDQFRLNVTLMHMLTGMFMMFGSCRSGGLLGQAQLARTSQISSRKQNEQLVC